MLVRGSSHALVDVERVKKLEILWVFVAGFNNT